MMKNYKVKVNDSNEFQFTEEQINRLDTQKLSGSAFHLLQNAKSYKAEITHADFLNRKYTVKINSNFYQVDISNELDLLIEEMGLTIGASKIINNIKAPMPGLILDVNIAEGDEVKEGDHLLVLEAMKMENTLTAPRDGVVKHVSVKKGQTVEKNQLLIEMD